jgi:hypothetical protein
MLPEIDASSTGPWPCAVAGHQPGERHFADNAGVAGVTGAEPMEEEGHALKTRRISTVLLAWAVWSLVLAAVGYAGDGPKLPPKRYEGEIRSIKIDRRGTEPGQCIGSILLAQKGGGEVESGIRPGTWLKRGANYTFVEDLGVGNFVTAEAVPMPGDRLQQITVLSSEG